MLRDDGTFAVYEVMRTGDGDLSFPVPWAETPDLSALETPQTYRDAAKRRGSPFEAEENRREVALDFFSRLQAQAASGAPPPLGLHNLMGPTVKEKVANMIAAVRAGTIAPVQMIFSGNPTLGAAVANIAYFPLACLLKFQSISAVARCAACSLALLLPRAFRSVGRGTSALPRFRPEGPTWPRKLSDTQLIILSTACQREGPPSVFPVTAKVSGGALRRY